MKKFLLALALTATAAITVGAAKVSVPPDVPDLYARSGAVISVGYSADVVTVEDSVGFRWEFNGCEDWIVGDVADLLMWDNNSPESILDDVVLDARYSGYNIADFQ